MSDALAGPKLGGARAWRLGAAAEYGTAARRGLAVVVQGEATDVAVDLLNRGTHIGTVELFFQLGRISNGAQRQQGEQNQTAVFHRHSPYRGAQIREEEALMKAPRVTLDQWRTLQAVVDHGGFAQAAEALHRSQSSVSYTVARMQEQLGAPLLRIDGRKAVLTEAGEVLLRRSRQLVKQASQLEELAHHMEQGWEAEVRLVVDAAYPTANIVRTLAAFMPQSNGCRVRLREEVLSGVEEVLLEGSADLAISALNITGYLPIELGEVEFIAVAHPEHSLHRLQRSVTFQDLENQMQVVIRDSGRLQPRDSGWLGAEQRWTVGSLPTARTFVSSGLGFAWLPRHLIARELAEGLLKPLPMSQGGTRRPRFYLYINKDKVLGPATQILIELIRNYDGTTLQTSPAAPLQDG